MINCCGNCVVVVKKTVESLASENRPLLPSQAGCFTYHLDQLLKPKLNTTLTPGLCPSLSPPLPPRITKPQHHLRKLIHILGLIPLQRNPPLHRLQQPRKLPLRHGLPPPTQLTHGLVHPRTSRRRIPQPLLIGKYTLCMYSAIRKTLRIDSARIHVCHVRLGSVMAAVPKASVKLLLFPPVTLDAPPLAMRYSAVAQSRRPPSSICVAVGDSRGHPALETSDKQREILFTDVAGDSLVGRVERIGPAPRVGAEEGKAEVVDVCACTGARQIHMFFVGFVLVRCANLKVPAASPLGRAAVDSRPDRPHRGDVARHRSTARG